MIMFYYCPKIFVIFSRNVASSIIYGLLSSLLVSFFCHLHLLLFFNFSSLTSISFYFFLFLPFSHSPPLLLPFLRPFPDPPLFSFPFSFLLFLSLFPPLSFRYYFPFSFFLLFLFFFHFFFSFISYFSFCFFFNFTDTYATKTPLLCAVIFSLYECNNRRIEKIPSTLFNNSGENKTSQKVDEKV